ncbi:helix-turn-helix domain-containing protein [Paucibacter sp. R3-3]|uniref:Helix-turn-helix domain-containing protein n=1 Tax=Roseateles agri TaxID=3098619 RepID=A0ABU5DPL3_9BURK|nr:helix-turn-helix domain-containing protein [Paucibacter sp. R3-3]MDY0748270.1 helix-turn-helix domain-containing protein [Paucibacter sp. R3-3]
MPALSTSGRPRESVRKPVVDRRISRTRQSIDKAFLLLLQKRGYESVGVSDIVREANVGRATFYEHYTSKDELLRVQLRQVLGAMLRGGPDQPDLLDAMPLFAHVREVPMLYRLVAGRSAAARSLRIVQEVLEERAAEILTERLSAGWSLRAPLEPPIAARLIVANLAALLAWWTENGMKEPASEMQALFQSSVGSMLVPTGK